MTANVTPGDLRINAHEIGRALTSLGFVDRKRMNAGYIVWLDLRTRKQIHKITGSTRKSGSSRQASPPTVTCARIQDPRILLSLKRKELAEPNRKSRELRVLRVHESDYRLVGKPHESWPNLEWGNRSSGCSPGNGEMPRTANPICPYQRVASRPSIKARAPSAVRSAARHPRKFDSPFVKRVHSRRWTGHRREIEHSR
jgi:hypothetical protein